MLTTNQPIYLPNPIFPATHTNYGPVGCLAKTTFFPLPACKKAHSLFSLQLVAARKEAAAANRAAEAAQAAAEESESQRVQVGCPLIAIILPCPYV